MLKSIGNYHILKIIAEHGPTTICLAKHQKLNRKTVLKIFKGADASLLKRFEREAQIVAELNDPRIVAIYDFGEEKGLYFISMEYVEGGNLKEYLEKTKLNTKEKLDLAYQIVEAVAVLHKKNFIHRDLKPENILVDKNQNIKLTDFGIAFHEKLHHMTTEGALLGTPLYMSPEQINNLPLTPASDVFSLGIIFYQMITGKHPFEAPRIGEIFSRILTKKIENLKDLETEYPQWFLDLINDMLEKEPVKRPSSALEVLKIFHKHLRADQSETVTLKDLDEKKVNKPILIGSIAFMVLLAVIIVWLTSNTNRPPLSQSNNFVVADTLITTLSDSFHKQNTNAKIKTPQENEDSNYKKQNNDQTVANLNPQLSEVVIKTNPWCRLYLNYQLIDSTPMLKPLKLKPGEYILGLQNPLYPSYTKKIKVQPGSKNVFEFNLDSIFSRLDLQVIPWGDVYIDGKFVGKTPLQKPLYLTKEIHVLEIKNSFYGTYLDTIDFRKSPHVQKQIAMKDLKP